MQIILYIFAGLAAAMFAIVVVRAVYESPIVGAVIVALLVLAEAVLVEMPELKVGISLYPHDFACALFATAGLLRLMYIYRPKSAQLFLIGLCVCFFYSLWRGIGDYGLQPAGNESRGTAYALCAAFYFMTFSYDEAKRRQLINVLFACAGGLACLALLRWGALFVHIPVPGNWSEVGGGKPLRVLEASQALIICQVAMLAWAVAIVRRRDRLPQVLMYVLPLIVLILQHRSVWVAGAVGAAWYYYRSGRAERFNWINAVMITLAGILALCVVFLIAGDSFFYMLQDSAVETTRDHSTLAWRFAGWQDLLLAHAQSGANNWIFGQPFGAGFRRVIGGMIWDQGPHSYFVQILLRTGFAGAVMLFGIYSTSLRRSSPLLQAWLITQIVFFIAYSPGMEQGLILGIAMGCLSYQRAVAPMNRSAFAGKAAIATA